MPHTRGALLFLLHSAQFCLRGCNSLWRCFPAASVPCADIRPTSYPHCCGLFRTLSLAFSRLTRQMPIGLFSLPLLESFNSRGSCAFLRVALSSDHWLPAPTRSVSPLAAVPKSFEPSHPLNGVTYIPLSVSLQVALRPHEIRPKLARYFVHRHEIRVIILGNAAPREAGRPFLKKSRAGLGRNSSVSNTKKC